MSSAASFATRGPAIRIRLTTDAVFDPLLLDLSSFVYDFNLLYEICRLATDRAYQDFRFTDTLWFRNTRPLRREDRLVVQSLRFGSPLELVLAVSLGSNAAVAAVWGVVQIAEKIWNMPLQRRKLKAETEKLERENRQAAYDAQDYEALKALLRRRGADPYVERIVGRLEVGRMRVSTIEASAVGTPRSRRKED